MPEKHERQAGQYVALAIAFVAALAVLSLSVNLFK